MSKSRSLLHINARAVVESIYFFIDKFTLQLTAQSSGPTTASWLEFWSANLFACLRLSSDCHDITVPNPEWYDFGESYFSFQNKSESSPFVGDKSSIAFSFQKLEGKKNPPLPPFFLNSWFLSQLEEVCQGKGNRMPLHDFWALGTSNAEHSGFCCFAQNNFLHSKPHQSALHNNSFCAIWLTASDTKLPGCLTCTSGSCRLFLLNFKLQVRNREWISIRRKCTEKLQKVISGVLKQTFSSDFTKLQ